MNRLNKSLVSVIVVILLVLGGLAVFKLSSKPPVAPTQSENLAAGQTREEGTAAEVVEIEIKDFSFSPITLSVPPGAKIKVKNLDSAAHTVTSDTELFDTGLIAQNQTAEFTAPAEPGSYPYHCTPHPSMKATLVVE